jgi:hypothetical protein
LTIQWGNITFDGPYRITTWDPPYRAAVYAIMYKQDPNSNTYYIIYFGESSNLSDRGFYRSHHKFQCWLRAAGSESNIYIGIYQMPNSSPEERRRVESALINQYNPRCND